MQQTSPRYNHVKPGSLSTIPSSFLINLGLLFLLWPHLGGWLQSHGPMNLLEDGLITFTFEMAICIFWQKIKNINEDVC